MTAPAVARALTRHVGEHFDQLAISRFEPGEIVDRRQALRAAADPRARPIGRCRALGELGRQRNPRDIENAHRRAQAPLERPLPRGTDRVVAGQQHGRRRFLQGGERRQHRRVAPGRLRQGRREKPHRALARLDVARRAAQMPQHDEGAGGDAVARRRRIVVPGLGPVKEPLVVVAREEESTVLGVLELVQQDVRELPRPCVVLGAKPRLQELQQRAEQESVVVEIGVEVRAFALPRGEEPAIAPRGAPQRVGGRDREVGPARLVQRARGARESGNGERVPRRQDLVVEAGSNPGRARGEQRRLRRGEPRVRPPSSGIDRRDATSASDARTRRFHAWPSKFGAPSSP